MVVVSAKGLFWLQPPPSTMNITIRQLCLSAHVPEDGAYEYFPSITTPPPYSPPVPPPQIEQIAHIAHDPHMIRSLHHRLQNVLRTHPVASEIADPEEVADIRYILRRTRTITRCGKPTTTDLSAAILNACNSLLELLGVSWPKVRREEWIPERSIKPDVAWIGPVVVFWENRSWVVGDRHMSEIHQLAAADGGRGSEFASKFKHFPLTGKDAIIAKLTVAMLHSGARFGVLFNSKNFQFFRIAFVRDCSNQPRPYVTVSDTMPLTTQNPSPIQILLSMMLRVDEDDMPPSPEHLQPPPPSPILLGRTFNEGGAGLNNLASAGNIGSASSLQFNFLLPDGNRYPSYTMLRTEPLPPGSRSPLPNPSLLGGVSGEDNRPGIVLHQPLGGGSTSTTLIGKIGHGVEIVAKFAHYETRAEVLKEGWFYENPLKSLCGTVLPSYFGVFEGEGRTALLTAYAGTPIKSFDLSESARQHIFNHITSLHRLGISHNDLELRNILAGPNERYTIIDLGCATIHTCSERCYEMTEMRKLLGIPH
ncbi:hypothetical protein BOTBODRAFT_535288 [Botryobasidium botryosum FD-172 SS1]|uniref:Protein kinase domain-containing protein n=1 Tax=Botryobasidium botryosum (strain FD-172 SS1) TaxID=930990 RepID=A0A067M022_BOTB1|nr:hypothetical protein BOTBODRAFT_535288 [Botryobasidium botryosum FD-172 SS1]